MKQIVITAAGKTDVFRIQAGNDLEPGNKDAIIKVVAAGINFADILARKGLYPDAPPFPVVVGYEVSGIVEQVGKDVDKSLIGKEVLSLTRFGGYSDYVKVPAENILFKPKSLSFEQAAALPVNYLTAFVLLVVMGSLRSNETILIHNAGGGVGLAALDIAKRLGAKTYGTASPSKHDFLFDRGLDFAIDYRNSDWLPILMDLTDGKGVELVIDPLGGQNWKKSYKALRSTGRLGMFGVSTVTKSSLFGKFRFLNIAVQMPWFNPIGLMNNNKSVFGVNMGHLWSEPEKVKSWFEDILNGVKEGWVKPHVDRVFSFENVAAAHTYIEERKNIGKVILVP